jgi:uncharacterized Zn finger protein
MTHFSPNTGHMSEKPRRVRGGLRLAARQYPPALSWWSQRWLDAVLLSAREHEMREGFEYARSGQTRGLTIEPGRASASIQGRAVRPYKAVVQVQSFTDEQWEGVIGLLAESALISGRLLAGELPEGIEEPFDRLGLCLFPKQTGDAVAACTAPNERPWCKHACCLALLLAEALEKDPLQVFALRGLPPGELVERLRDRRAAGPGGGVQGGTSPVAVIDLADRRLESSPPLEDSLDDYWDLGPGLGDLETPIRPPEVSHPLLRRLGPSPFPESRFPLLGLLATCYDTISKEAIAADSDCDPTPAGGARAGDREAGGPVSAA